MKSDRYVLVERSQLQEEPTTTPEWVKCRVLRMGEPIEDSPDLDFDIFGHLEIETPSGGCLLVDEWQDI